MPRTVAMSPSFVFMRIALAVPGAFMRSKSVTVALAEPTRSRARGVSKLALISLVSRLVWLGLAMPGAILIPDW